MFKKRNEELLRPNSKWHVQHQSTGHALDPEIAAIAIVFLLIQSSPGPSDLQSEFVLLPPDFRNLTLNAFNALLHFCLGGKIICDRSGLDDPSQLFDYGL